MCEWKHAHTACKLNGAVLAVADLVQMLIVARPGKAGENQKLSACQKWVCANQRAEQGTAAETGKGRLLSESRARYCCKDREGEATVTRATWERVPDLCKEGGGSILTEGPESTFQQRKQRLRSSGSRKWD